MDDSKTENHRGKILLACTGSVASIKVPIIVDALLKLKVAEIVLYGLDYIYIHKCGSRGGGRDIVSLRIHFYHVTF